MGIAEKIIIALLNPARLLIAIWKRLGIGSFSFRLRFDALPRPNYAYGVYWAAFQAKRLNIPRMSVIEFGVAGGNGLVILEQHAEAVEKELGIEIDVYGFDRVEGLPNVSDYRDMPHWFAGGSYKMDMEKLRSRLKRARLILGDASETAKQFLESCPAPVGFISFDVDLYSSTKSAFQVFNLPDESLLPRVICYFDNILGWDWFFGNEFTGERLAISEFNQASETQKIAKIYGLELMRTMRSKWSTQMFCFHRFNHAKYNEYIAGDPSKHLLALSNRPK